MSATSQRPSFEFCSGTQVLDFYIAVYDGRCSCQQYSGGRPPPYSPQPKPCRPPPQLDPSPSLRGRSIWPCATAAPQTRPVGRQARRHLLWWLECYEREIVKRLRRVAQSATPTHHSSQTGFSCVPARPFHLALRYSGPADAAGWPAGPTTSPVVARVLRARNREEA
eukprot:SAG22_NODE_119_length_19257_cov_43.260413_19_plen_167_part_00